MSWSGGKDSFLAYRALERQKRFSLVLLTTFDARSRIIAHQEIPIDEVVEQAKRLDAPLIGVSLHSGPGYVDQVLPALDLVPDFALNSPKGINRCSDVEGVLDFKE